MNLNKLITTFLFATLFWACAEGDSSVGSNGDSLSSSDLSSCDDDDNCEYITDKRDGKKYKTVKIGDQWWMAENLDYTDVRKTPSLKDNMWCYGDDEENCKKYGHLYSWPAAIDSIALVKNSKNPMDCGYGRRCFFDGYVRGICPEGWHLPSDDEWNTLFDFLGDISTMGMKLKSVSGWHDDGNGTDDYGFTALPAGVRDPNTYFYKKGERTYFWSTNEFNSYLARVMITTYYEVDQPLTSLYKSTGVSIRCVKDGSKITVKSSSSIKSSSSKKVSSSSSVKNISSSSTKNASSSSILTSSSSCSGAIGSSDSKNNSSSSVSQSSSGKSSDSKLSSSSSLPEGWNWDVPQTARLNPKIKYDTMIDPRDKRVYKIVKIAPVGKDYSQVWMAENLNYADSVKTPSLKGRNACYRDSAKYCEVGGRYYSWMAAIDYLKLANDSADSLDCGRGKTCAINNRKVRGVCPDGWHLPSKDEWGRLIVALGNSEIAGKHLKAQTGWDKEETANNNGDDAYGFSALPTGKVLSSGEFDRIGSNVYYWSSYENGERDAVYMNINNLYTQAYLTGKDKSEKLTIRCVKDESALSVTSSSSAKSSSSVAKSSSSIVKTPISATSTNYGVMIDERDGQAYSTVLVGDQVWIKDNMNYEMQGSYCYEDDSTKCSKYGRLYTWDAAKSACPSGFHLPSYDEYDALFENLGGAIDFGKNYKSSTGWVYDGNGRGYTEFTVYPAGFRRLDGQYDQEGWSAFYWSSTEVDDGKAYDAFIYHNYINVPWHEDDKGYGYSVRCVQGKLAVSSSSSVAKSSSSIAKSSSSESKSSSSLVAADAWNWDVSKEDYFNPDIHYDTMIDPRDNQVYKIVTIALEEKNYSQVWMAENLNYADSVRTPSLKGQSWCYLDSAKYCKVAGRYYTWMAAIDSVALATDSDNPMECGYNKECEINKKDKVQGICPDGWHLPSKDELGQLIVALGNSYVAGQKLKSLFGWGSSAEGRGNDAYGFTALPVGRRMGSGRYAKVGTDDYFWSSSEYNSKAAKYMNMNNIYSQAYMSQDSKDYGQSVRCVKD